MSSHHIVKEKQEPALLILDIQGTTEDHLGQMLEWSPTLICNQDSYEVLHARGIKADVLLQKGAAEGHLQEHLRTIFVAENELKTAFQFLITEAYPAVNIVTQDFHTSVYQVYAGKIDIVVLCQHQRIFSIKSGFSKWKPAGEEIRIHTKGVNMIASTGLKQLDEQTYLTLKDGFYSFTFYQERIFISEAL